MHRKEYVLLYEDFNKTKEEINELNEQNEETIIELEINIDNEKMKLNKLFIKDNESLLDKNNKNQDISNIKWNKENICKIIDLGL
ncbi:hypothetical protein U3516DRAFT_764630 [Neocallimastix sp. 'constans']